MELLSQEYPEIILERDTKMVRGLDYYNGTCFEFKMADDQPLKEQELFKKLFGESQNTILAGGRYDYLAS